MISTILLIIINFKNKTQQIAGLLSTYNLTLRNCRCFFIHMVMRNFFEKKNGVTPRFLVIEIQTSLIPFDYRLSIQTLDKPM